MSTEKPTKTHQQAHFDNELGISAEVRRSAEEGEPVRRANSALNEIGEYIHENSDTVRQLEYVGSAAVHCYIAPALQQMVFVTQTEPLKETNELIAGAAFTQLKKDFMARYSRNPGKARSGF